MTFDSSLMIGIVLVFIGIAFGLLAYAVMLNRGGREETPEEIPESSGLQEEPSELAPSAVDVPEGEPAVPAPEAPAEALGDAPVEPPVAATSTPPDLPSAEEVADIAEPPALQEGRIEIATLLRDGVSGNLIVKIGDREYRRTSEISDPLQRRRVEFAAVDLAGWFAEAMQLHQTESGEREEGDIAPSGMVEQINEILEKKLEHSESGIRGVRLAEDPSGGVRVFVGLKSYPIDEVPDTAISQLIHEAVAEWEASQ